MPARRFRKKPVEIHAVLNTGEWTPIIEFLDAVGAGRVPFGHMPYITRNDDGTLNIQTLEGVMRADIGDWVIRGVKGEFYPCKPDVFAETYEPVPREITMVMQPDDSGFAAGLSKALEELQHRRR